MMRVRSLDCSGRPRIPAYTALIWVRVPIAPGQAGPSRSGQQHATQIASTRAVSFGCSTATGGVPSSSSTAWPAPSGSVGSSQTAEPSGSAARVSPATAGVSGVTCKGRPTAPSPTTARCRAAARPPRTACHRAHPPEHAFGRPRRPRRRIDPHPVRPDQFVVQLVMQMRRRQLRQHPPSGDPVTRVVDHLDDSTHSIAPPESAPPRPADPPGPSQPPTPAHPSPRKAAVAPSAQYRYGGPSRPPRASIRARNPARRRRKAARRARSRVPRSRSTG